MSKKRKKLFLKNEILFKKLGRINSIFIKDLTNESADLVISGKYLKFILIKILILIL